MPRGGSSGRPRASPSPGSGGGGDEDAGDTLFKVDYRFSPGKVFRVVEQLSPEQQELVRSIGFGGLLDLPRYDKLDRHFSAWLFNQVVVTSTEPPSMADAHGAKVSITPRDVHEVLGVPLGGRAVALGQGAGADAEEWDVVPAVRRLLGLEPREELTLKHAKNVLDGLTAPPLARPAPPRMTPAQRDAFAVAFVVFVVGHFLAPRGLSERANTEVFHALANPSEIGSFDWAGYVLKEFVTCKDPQQHLRQRPPTSEASGSSTNTRGHQLSPNPELLGTEDYQERSMNPPAPPDASIGNRSWGPGPRPNCELNVTKGNKVLQISPGTSTDASGSTTTRGLQLSHNSESKQQDECMLVLRQEYEEYLQFKRFMQMKKNSEIDFGPNVNTCSGGRNKVAQHLPLYEVERESHGTESNSTTSGLLGPNALDSIGCNANAGGTPIPAAYGSSDRGKSFLISDNPTTTLDFSSANRTPCVQEGLNPEIIAAKKPRTRLASPSKETRKTKFHIEEATGEQASHYHMMQADVSSSAAADQVVGTGETNSHPSPAVVIDLEDQPDESGMASEADKGKKSVDADKRDMASEKGKKYVNACIKWFKSCRKDDEQLKRVWIVHNKPTPIEATGETIRSQFFCGNSLEPDICNLMLRCFRGLDDKNTEPRCRHFLPAEWAALALQHGSNLITVASPAVRSMFSGPHIIYDVKRCRMIIAPVQCRKGEWSCYVWDFEEKRFNILDPLINERGSNLPEVQRRHEPIKHRLHGALFACRAKYCSSSSEFDHQESSWNDWPMVFLQGLGGKHVFKSYNSGLYMLHFAREFDGQNLKTVRKIGELRGDLLYELLNMSGNTGHLPATFPIHV